jgi:Na+-transporting NADH:ubiquinone oxidoreductase subunit NqrD
MNVNLVKAFSNNKGTQGLTEFPLHSHAKLVTYLMIASVLSWFCVTKFTGDKMKNIPQSIKFALQLIILAIAVIAIYEFTYNFFF